MVKTVRNLPVRILLRYRQLEPTGALLTFALAARAATLGTRFTALGKCVLLLGTDALAIDALLARGTWLDGATVRGRAIAFGAAGHGLRVGRTVKLRAIEFALARLGVPVRA